MISLFNSLSFSFILLFLGITGIMIRKNALFTLISIEIILSAIGLSIAILSTYWDDINGQIFFLTTLTCAASDSVIGLALLLQLYRIHKTLNIDLLNEMKK
ncbi:NADH-quinone oxidoreductase subunit K [Buchnera aphidicola (Anoecia corni)]|uniref:NADH-quinone oxidoreductase subunit K n=1 Tax=Buchnera aphidicola (Anoecia corni) TaxID=2994477 RepID=A0AAT9IG15_9GAMM